MTLAQFVTTPTPTEQAGLDGAALCVQTKLALEKFVDILNQETTLLRTGKLEQAGKLSATKAEVAQEYVILARSIKNNAAALTQSHPAELKALKGQHETLATQMAENVRVLATARTVTADLLHDVAKTVGAQRGPTTYGTSGRVPPPTATQSLSGLTLNRAL